MQGEELEQLMFQRGFRLQHALSRKMDSTSSTPRLQAHGSSSQRGGDLLSAPFRNGYSLTHKYERQLNGPLPGESSEESAIGSNTNAVPTMLL
jgi:hypothetical protein